MVEIIDAIELFIEKGGSVLYALLFLAFVLWTLLCQRYIYLLFFAKILKRKLLKENRFDVAMPGWKKLKIKEYLVNIYTLALHENLPIIKTLVIIAPFLGLLGTVAGMIEIFDVMALTGSSDARSMSSGVGRATIPTLSGMVISISGLFFINLYENRLKQEIQSLREML